MRGGFARGCAEVTRHGPDQVRQTRGGQAGSPHALRRHAAHTPLNNCINGSTRGAKARNNTTWACGEVAPAPALRLQRTT
jgi:hypothetical protein